MQPVMELIPSGEAVNPQGPQSLALTSPVTQEAQDRAAALRALELETEFGNRVAAVKFGDMDIGALWEWMGGLSTLETESLFNGRFALK